jgi:hypothetical protein
VELRMNWFSRGRADNVNVSGPYTSGQSVLTPTVEVVALEPKPDELVNAVARAGEWTRSSRVDREAHGSALSAPWLMQPPMVPGLYWWRPLAPVVGEARLGAVTTFGGSLVVRRRKGDSSSYITVGVLAREWAGPIAIPADAKLEDFEEVNA